jgi:hypothetical protein
MQRYWLSKYMVHIVTARPWRVNDITQSIKHTSESLVLQPTSCKVEIATEMLKRYKSPDTVSILTELIQAAGKTLLSETHKHNY